MCGRIMPLVVVCSSGYTRISSITPGVGALLSYRVLLCTRSEREWQLEIASRLYQ